MSIMEHPPADPDDAAMLRLSAGEDRALDELMSRWSSRLTGFLVRLTSDSSVSRDLAQETFVRLYQARERFRPGGTFKALLFQIASNLARNHASWKSRHPETSIDREEFPEPSSPEHADPSHNAEAGETAAAVGDAVRDLPEDLRTPLVLSVYEELEHKQIGEILGCSAKAVEMRIYRARNLLRESLKAFMA